MLSGNYYIGVFETTQTQYGLVQTEYANSKAPYTKGAMFPMELVCYNELRVAEASTASNSSYDYPNEPYEKSFLGLLRAKTGLRFDLPSEAQWEFACRAGNGFGLWGDGSPIAITNEKDSNLDALGCYSNKTTVAVGSYKPNDWGLYDMHGNVIKLCLDYYTDDITGNVNGEVNTSGPSHVCRGGRFNAGASSCRSACRTASTAASSLTCSFLGFRLVIAPSSSRSFHVE